MADSEYHEIERWLLFRLESVDNWITKSTLQSENAFVRHNYPKDYRLYL